MRHARRFFAKLRAFLWRGQAERELEREVASHLALLADDFEVRGISPAEARLAARRAYGGVEAAKQLQRDERSFAGLENLLEDTRHALRALAHSRYFAATAVLSLALGIGVNGAIFTLVNDVLLRRLPVRDPERIVEIAARLSGSGRVTGGFSYPAFLALRQQDGLFQMTAGFFEQNRTLDVGSLRSRVPVQLVAGDFFRLFDGQPILGRLLDGGDDRLRSEPFVCVVSDRAWKRYWNRDPGVLRETVRLGGKTFHIVGVVNPGFVGAELQQQFDFWAPTGVLDFRDSPNHIWIAAMARLAPGVSAATASARLEASSAWIESQLPPKHANAGAVYRLVDGSKGHDSFRSELRHPLAILMAAAAMVLLLASANLTNLFLARVHDREQEFAVKLALGSSRWRLARQLLIEVLLIAAAGGAAAVLLAHPLHSFLLSLFNAGKQYRVLETAPGVDVLWFTLAACLVTALLAGLYPAWRGSRTGAGPAFRRTAESTARTGLSRAALIVTQLALAVILVFGASLFAHSLRELRRVPLGYDIEDVRMLHVVRKQPVRAPGGQPQLEAIAARLRQFPGVDAAAWTDASPLSSAYTMNGVQLAGGKGTGRETDAVLVVAGPGYFETLRMPLMRGRDFTPADRGASRPVAVINQRLAAELGIEADAIGRRLSGLTQPNEPPAEIVGIVGNCRSRGVRAAEHPMVYLAFDQVPGDGGDLLVRYHGSAAHLERNVSQLIQAESAGYEVANSLSMEQLRDRLLAQDRLLAWLAQLFGALGMALALVGVYGLIAYSVTRRTREVGIRLSIGAQRGQVLGLFLRESALWIGMGVILGLPLAFLLARFVQKLLFGISPLSAADAVLTVALLLLGGLAAAWLPARRAANMDPVRALRYD